MAKVLVSSKGRVYCGKCGTMLAERERNTPKECSYCREKAETRPLRGNVIEWAVMRAAAKRW
jgi:putative hemolysin